MDSSQMISRENVVFDSICPDWLCYFITYFKRRFVLYFLSPIELRYLWLRWDVRAYFGFMCDIDDYRRSICGLCR